MCYEIDILQQVIDDEYEGDKEALLEHLLQCPKCRQAYEALKKTDEFTGNALRRGMLIPPVKQFNVKHNAKSEKNRKMKGENTMNKTIRRFVATAAVLAVCAGLFSSQTVRSFASDFLKIFRVSDIKSISISQKDFAQIEQIFKDGKGQVNIKDLISVDMKAGQEKVEESNITDYRKIKEADASALLVTPPEGYKYTRYQTQPKAQMSYKLNVAKINEVLKYLGEDIRLENGLDQKEFTLNTGNILNYDIALTGGQAGSKSFGVTQMDLPTLEVPQGVDEKQLIDALLKLKIVPENVKQQLIGIGDITTTLPVVYDTDEQTKTDITIHGQKGVALKQKDSDVETYNIVFKEKDKLILVHSLNLKLDELTEIFEHLE